MVKTREQEHAIIVKARTKEMIHNYFGKHTLIHRKKTRTVDDFGYLTVITDTDTTFTGDLQFGTNLDAQLLSSGIVEIGDALLYVDSFELSQNIQPWDQIIDNNSVWWVLAEVENPELGGTSTHKMYRCRREINSSDTS